MLVAVEGCQGSRRVALALVSVLTAVVLGGCGSQEGATGYRGSDTSTNQAQDNPPTFSSATVSQLAHAAAVGYGNRHPTDVAAVRSTHEKAVSVLSMGRGSDGNEQDVPVEVITMHGLIGASAHEMPPPGHHIRAGVGWLTITINAATGERLDTDIGDKRPALERLGKVRYLASPNS